MSRFVILCLVVAISISEGRDVIPREFQNINIDNYLKNERAVRFQLKCVTGDGPCDRIGKYLKQTIPEILENQCANCDDKEKERAGKLLTHIQDNFPEEWEKAVKKFQESNGGLVKPEDAAKLESILGVKIDPKLIGTPPA
ncbi:putative odorant-binding protein A10 [Orchesella cincta]|uniref:Putative odorant-binding protein A10 n=1 Tax=Orchesella cincta TaxID=48709 RepID=A0A1D2MYF3_ORCCI|nr:putative odorant-binding protein A10 [Orchesella cincta]